jgi:hypothetical protein
VMLVGVVGSIGSFLFVARPDAAGAWVSAELG